MSGEVRITGGEKMEKFLTELTRKLSDNALLKVGFMEGANYEDGNPVAYIAAIQEFGGTANIPAHDVTINRSINEKTGEFNKNGRFVKADKANFQTKHRVEAYSITIPPRPYFRRMIDLGKEHWGKDMAKTIKATDYEPQKAMELIGEQMIGELRESIKANVYHPLAKSTIAQKGHAQQLVDTGNMLRSVAKEVDA